jgi:hypothetical protein
MRLFHAIANEQFDFNSQVPKIFYASELQSDFLGNSEVAFFLYTLYAEHKSA